MSDDKSRPTMPVENSASALSWLSILQQKLENDGARYETASYAVQLLQARMQVAILKQLEASNARLEAIERAIENTEVDVQSILDSQKERP